MLKGTIDSPGSIIKGVQKNNKKGIFGKVINISAPGKLLVMYLVGNVWFSSFQYGQKNLVETKQDLSDLSVQSKYSTNLCQNCTTRCLKFYNKKKMWWRFQIPNLVAGKNWTSRNLNKLWRNLSYFIFHMKTRRNWILVISLPKFT